MSSSNPIISHSVNDIVEQRLNQLDSRLTSVAWRYANGDYFAAEDLKSEMHLALFGKAVEDPADFQTRADKELITYAARVARSRAIDKSRSAEGRNVSLDDGYEELLGEEASDSSLDLEYLFAAVPAKYHDILRAIIEAGEIVLCESSGRLNMTALAEYMGRPVSTLKYQIAQLREVVPQVF